MKLGCQETPGTSPCKFVLAGNDFHSSEAREFRRPAQKFAVFSRVSLPRNNSCASIRRERRAFQGIFRFSFASARSETQGPSHIRGKRTARSFSEGALFLLSEKF